MIATTDAYKTVGCVGQNCINASFMSLSSTIDSWKDQKNCQDYKTLSYCGRIDLSTTLCCAPPQSDMNVYGTPGDGRLYCIGHMDSNGVVTFTDVSSIKTVCNNTYSWSTSARSSYYPYSYGIHSFDTFTAWNDPSSIDKACFTLFCDNCICQCYCDGTVQYCDGCVCQCEVEAGSFQCSKDLNVCRSIRCYDVVEQWLEDPGEAAVGIAIGARADFAFGHIIDVICWTCTCQFTSYDGSTVCAPYIERPEDCVIGYIRYNVNPNETTSWYCPNPYDNRCVMMCTYLNVFPWNVKCLYMDGSKLMPLTECYDCYGYDAINAGGFFDESTVFSPKLTYCCGKKESMFVEGFNQMFSPSCGSQSYPSNEKETVTCTCTDDDGNEVEYECVVSDNTYCLLRPNNYCCYALDPTMSNADDYCWEYCRRMSEASSTRPTYWNVQSNVEVYCSTKKEWQWIYCAECHRYYYECVDTDECQTFPHYIASNPNGIHVSSDQTVKCPDVDISWDTDNGSCVYINCLHCLADQGYCVPTVRLMTIDMTDCTCTEDDTTQCLGWFVNGCCYALASAMTLDTVGWRGVCNVNDEEVWWDWTCQCASINFLSTFTVVRRKTTVYCVNETITRSCDLSDRVWCVYMEYV